MGLSHGTVEDQLTAGITCWNRKFGAVPALSYPGQRTASAGLFRGLLLAILHNGHHLFVDLLVKRTVDGPVVRDAHLLPPAVIEGCLLSPLCRTLMEPPPVQQKSLGTLCHHGQCYGTVQKQKKQSSFHLFDLLV